jgi:hypothetical protein
MSGDSTNEWLRYLFAGSSGWSIWKPPPFLARNPLTTTFPLKTPALPPGGVVAEDGGTDRPERTQFPRSRPGLSSRPSAMHEQAAGLAAHEVALLEPVMAVDSAKFRSSAAYRMRS